MKFSSNNGRASVWLASANADGVITLSDDWISILGYHAKIAVLQVQIPPSDSHLVQDEPSGIHEEQFAGRPSRQGT